jgi:SAM-dependent methyltransferase
MQVVNERVGLDLLAERDEGYGGKSRASVISRLRPPLGDVLDIGCGEGGSADALRAHGATSLTGVELSPEFAEVAQGRYDEVAVGSTEEVLGAFEPESFDVILCYDVLEHLYDPWSVLTALRPLLRPDGRLQISVPNARHKDVWIPLVLGGTFNYQSAGLMDVTHIRFFGLRDVVKATQAAGFCVLSAGGPPPGSLKRRIAYRLTGGRAAEFVTAQWYVVATPA